MAKLHYFSLLLFIALGHTLGQAEDNGQDTAKKKDSSTIIVVRHQKGAGLGPRMPSNRQLLVEYRSSTQECEVRLDSDMEWASVTIEQIPVGFYYVGEVSQEVQSFSVEIPAGYYRITCETDGGSTFVGEGDLD